MLMYLVGQLYSIKTLILAQRYKNIKFLYLEKNSVTIGHVRLEELIKP